MAHLQIYNHFKLDFQKVDQHTGGKWLFIHCTKHRKENQFQSLELRPVANPSKKSKHDIKESEGNILNPIFKRECPETETAWEVRSCRSRTT